MIRKTTYFEEWSWFKFNNLERHYLWPWKFTPVWQRVKIKSQKVLEANSDVCRSCMEKLVGRGSFLPLKSWIGLNEFKWEDFFCQFYKRATSSVNFRRLYRFTICLNYAWEINQLIYPFELGLLISHTLHLQVFNAANNLKATSHAHSFLGCNESFTKLKIGDKSLFWHAFENVFCHQFYF